MTRFREEYYVKEAKRKKRSAAAVRPLSVGSDIARARAVRSEYFAKSLSVRKAIDKAQARQVRMF